MFDKIIISGQNIIIQNVKNFEPNQIFDCGQTFRWDKNENDVWTGIVGHKKIMVVKEDNNIILQNVSINEFNEFWHNYFDLSRDYDCIINEISTNQTIKNAAEFGSGIRILNQDPWETICSFIISQNNNIPRIKGIVKKLCENFGDMVEDFYTFPTAEKISQLTLDDLSVIKSGFRAKYILDAAQKIANKELNIKKLYTCDIFEARAELMKIKGVGPKVSDCILLFAFSRIEAFPQDVWIKRAMAEYFDGHLPKVAEKYAGIVQQYIFYYIRENSNK